MFLCHIALLASLKITYKVCFRMSSTDNGVIVCHTVLLCILILYFVIHSVQTVVNVVCFHLQQASLPSFLLALLTSLAVWTPPLVQHHNQIPACNLHLHDLARTTWFEWTVGLLMSQRLSHSTTRTLVGLIQLPATARSFLLLVRKLHS